LHYFSHHHHHHHHHLSYLHLFACSFLTNPTN
jgi:hypothetical protein